MASVSVYQRARRHALKMLIGVAIGVVFIIAVDAWIGHSSIAFAIVIFLIMFAVFNRFDKSYEEAARDQGATAWQTLRHVVLPIIAPSLIGVALFGFTLSYDEFARTLLTAGSYNTLPLEIFGMTTNVTTPVIYALGTLTTAFSFVIIAVFLVSVWVMGRRRARHGSDAGKAA